MLLKDRKKFAISFSALCLVFVLLSGLPAYAAADTSGADSTKATVSQENNEVKTAAKEASVTTWENGKIINTSGICQFPDYPTGCESVSAVMLLNYFGIDITVDKFISDYLDKSSFFYYRGGKLYGPDPNEYFVGDPKTEGGYGCMSSVIIKAMNKFIDTSKYKIINAGNVELSQLCSRYIDVNIPVMVWVSVDMNGVCEAEGWNLNNGTEYTWMCGEHCMLLVGYDENGYYLNDPTTGTCEWYDKYSVESSYEQMGKQAVTLREFKK